MVPVKPKIDEVTSPITVAGIILAKLEKDIHLCHHCDKKLKESETYVVTYREDGKYVFEVACNKCVDITRPVYIGTVENFIKRAKTGQLEEMFRNAKS